MITNIHGKKIKTRKCRDIDYNFVYTLLRRNMLPYFEKYWGGWNPKKFRESFNKKQITIIEHKTKRIGYYDVEIKKNHLYIHNIQISTFFRNKGIGRFVIGKIEKESKRNYLHKIRLRVFKDNPSRQFYKKMNYLKVRDDGSSIVLEKRMKI